MMLKKIILRGFLAISYLSISIAEAEKLQAPLDEFFNLAKLYSLTPLDLENLVLTEKYPQHPYFIWVNEQKEKGIIQDNTLDDIEVGLSLFDGTLPIDKIEVDFDKGQFEGITFHFFSRAESEGVSSEEFKRQLDALSQLLTTKLRYKPSRSIDDEDYIVSRYYWKTQHFNASLNFNKGFEKKAEFLRLRLSTKRTTTGVYKSATDGSRGESVRLNRFSSNLVKKDGNVYIGNFPMVDQEGAHRGSIATAQRLYEYYGIDSEMYQLKSIVPATRSYVLTTAKIFKDFETLDSSFHTTSALLGTNTGSGFKHPEKRKRVRSEEKAIRMNLENGPQLYKPKVYKAVIIENESMLEQVYSLIDDGIPAISIIKIENTNLKMAKPSIRHRTNEQHLRIIIGYNKKLGNIIFTDSFGKGHEFKTITNEDFLKEAIYIMTITPNGK